MNYWGGEKKEERCVREEEEEHWHSGRKVEEYHDSWW